MALSSRVTPVAVAVLSLGIAIAATSACDKDPPKVEPKTTPAQTAAPPSPPVSATPTKPQLAIDDAAIFVAGERFDIAGPDPKGRMVAALFGKPVEGETLVLNAARDTKMPRIAALFAALTAKKAKGATVRTALRDRTTGELELVTNSKAADCGTVGYIAKDSAISTWPIAGATAERFSHGLAGPDLTRGSEGIRKRVLACDSPVWFVSADDNVTWGLVFDMALAVMRPDDAGLPKPRSISVLSKPPVPGRKVDVSGE